MNLQEVNEITTKFIAERVSASDLNDDENLKKLHEEFRELLTPEGIELLHAYESIKNDMTTIGEEEFDLALEQQCPDWRHGKNPDHLAIKLKLNDQFLIDQRKRFDSIREDCKNFTTEQEIFEYGNIHYKLD